MWFQRNNIESKQYKTNPMIRLFKLIIWVLLIFIWIKYIWYSNFTSNPLIEEKTQIIVEKWNNYWDIAQKLSINYNYMRFYFRLNEGNYSLQAGIFDIPANSNFSQILEALEKPIYNEEKITLLEGWNIFDIDEYLVQKSLINKWEYIRYAENSQNIKKLSEKYNFLNNLETLEWYLYTDTYNINRANFSLENFIINQIKTFNSKVYQPLFANSNVSIENMQSVINLASIVEKEEKNPAYKKTVAWILKKRLKARWMIGADITVCYPYRLTANQCKLVISKYINDKNEYNTRTMAGLPKTPIWNPNYETIEATLNHKETPYFFYLHDKKWNIFYATTNAQHESNKYYYMK